MRKKEQSYLSKKLRNANHRAMVDNALEIIAIKLIERAILEEFLVDVLVGVEQPFRVESKTSKRHPVKAEDVASDIGAVNKDNSGFGVRYDELMGERFRPKIASFYNDDGSQKYEGCTSLGKALQVARWILEFRLLADLRKGKYPDVAAVHFSGAQHFEAEGSEPRRIYPHDVYYGLHVNTSIWKDGKNLSRHNKDLLLWQAVGIRDISRHTTLLVCESAASFKRYDNKTSSYTPAIIAIAREKGKRSVSIRTDDEAPDSTRVEDRLASGGANPYRAVLKTMLGCYLGLTRSGMVISDKGIDINNKPINPFKLGPSVPKDLAAAIKEFKGDWLFAALLNDLDKRYRHTLSVEERKLLQSMKINTGELGTAIKERVLREADRELRACLTPK